MGQDFSAAAKAELRQFAIGRHGHYRRTCPDCSPGRRNAKAQCLSVTIHSEHMVMSCHHCERSGATKLSDNLSKPFVPPAFEKPKPKAVKSLDVGLTEASINFLTERALSLKTAQAWSLVSSRAYFPDLRREDDGLAYPYFVGGKVQGHKVRCVTEKAHVCDTALSSLFGIQNVDLTESHDMIIAEGELDALSFYEAGVLNATSVPNGSSSFTKSNEDGSMRQQLGFLWDAKDQIEKAKRILIAADADQPGEKLAEELSRRVGRHRCWLIKYPDDCKDANDVLLKHGKDVLAKCVEEATPWPVEGLFEAAKYFPELDNLFENGMGEAVSTGMAAIDPYFKIAPGLLTVVTGNPNAGKSNWVNQVLLNVARSHGYISAVCSFETQPSIHLAQLAEMLIQKHFFDNPDTPGERMSKRELDSVKPFLHRHIKFLHQEDGAKSTIESIIERIKTAVFRWGANIVVIDPYSYIQRPKDMASETEFIADMLTRIRLTAKLYGVHVFFIAHPAKPSVNSDGTTSVPTGYSISGSAHWFNHPDHGLTVHRNKDTNTVEIRVWKTRFSPWFGQNGSAEIFYDAMRHNYVSDNWDSMEPYAA